jgi:Helitron helicase-like domain at N-terminus
MQKLFHNSMVLVRVLSKPNLFITMTSNPPWLENTDELDLVQNPLDHPYVVVLFFSSNYKQ